MFLTVCFILYLAFSSFMFFFSEIYELLNDLLYDYFTPRYLFILDIISFFVILIYYFCVPVVSFIWHVFLYFMYPSVFLEDALEEFEEIDLETVE